MAAAKRIGRPDVLEVSGPRAAVLSSGRLRDRFLGTVDRVEREPARLRIEEGVPGKDAVTFRFLVRGTGELKVTFRSEKGGALERDLVLP
jgi:hypothetical protein